MWLLKKTLLFSPRLILCVNYYALYNAPGTQCVVLVYFVLLLLFVARTPLDRGSGKPQPSDDSHCCPSDRQTNKLHIPSIHNYYSLLRCLPLFCYSYYIIILPVLFPMWWCASACSAALATLIEDTTTPRQTLTELIDPTQLNPSIVSIVVDWWWAIPAFHWHSDPEPIVDGDLHSFCHYCWAEGLPGNAWLPDRRKKTKALFWHYCVWTDFLLPHWSAELLENWRWCCLRLLFKTGRQTCYYCGTGWGKWPQPDYYCCGQEELFPQLCIILYSYWADRPIDSNGLLFIRPVVEGRWTCQPDDLIIIVWMTETFNASQTMTTTSRVWLFPTYDFATFPLPSCFPLDRLFISQLPPQTRQ